MNKNSLTGIGITANIVFIVAAFFSLAYSVKHYSDGGCDGGLCGLGIIFHGLPLAISWLFTIIALNTCLIGSRAFYVFIVLAAAVNFIILSMDFGYQLSELKIPGYCLILVHVLLSAVFITSYTRIRQNGKDSVGN